MLTVDDYGAIRRARRDGKSIRQIASDFQHSRNTIRKILKQAEPNPLPSTRNRFAPLLGPVESIIDQILIDDETAPPKQRHTAAQVFRRVRDEYGYAGGYVQVRRYLRKHRRSHVETFIPLGHLPGQRLEADFGHIHVDFPDGRRLVPFLVTAWAYSNAPFVMALPFERTEPILEGMVAAFEFFGAVPKEVWWDNPRTVATLILSFQVPTFVNEVILPVERGRVEVQPIENSSPSFFDTEPCRADHVHHRRVYLSVMPV